MKGCLYIIVCKESDSSEFSGLNPASTSWVRFLILGTKVVFVVVVFNLHNGDKNCLCNIIVLKNNDVYKWCRILLGNIYVYLYLIYNKCI